MPVAIQPHVNRPTSLKHGSPTFDVDDVLSRLSLPDKVSLLSGKDNWHTKGFPELGVPSLRLSDGPNGCRGTKFFEGVPAACFPCATGLASTWDRCLLEAVGVALGEECRAKGAHVLLAPTVNMHRVPLNGRGFESFSEDPTLSGKLAGSLIRGCQSTGVAAALKHFVCNDQESSRYSISAEVDERTLREIYLKPFEIAIRDSNPWVVMTSYNRVNGVHVSENADLVQDILRREWGWDGMVVSDWHGTYSSDGAVNAGVDLEMPGPSIIRGPALLRMVTCGKVDVKTIDERARQILRLAKRLLPSGIPSGAEETINTCSAIGILRQAAADSIVLLKNERNILPLSAQPRKIAVIGPNAARAEISGGGSAALRPTYTVSPLEGIQNAVSSDTEVLYAKGCDAHKLTPLIGEHLRNVRGEPGFDVTFYNESIRCNSLALPIHRLTTTNSNMFFNDNLPDELNKACYARAVGTFTPSVSGTYAFGAGALGAVDLYIDDSLLIDNSSAPVPGELFFGKGSREETAEIYLLAGQTYTIRVEYASPSASTSFVGPLALSSRGGVRFGGYHKLSEGEHIQEAIEVAQTADAVIMVVGLNAEFETEGFDRTDMSLPAPTLRLIDAILSVRPDTVICVQSGSAVAMPFASRASTIVQFFYNGNEVGNGLADVLFGKVNPSGKLPYTIAQRLEDYTAISGSGVGPAGTKSSGSSVTAAQSFPGVDGRVHYHEGVFVGYRQFTTFGPKPTFTFGHGLSYTSYEYTDCRVERPDGPVGPNTKLSVLCTITNTGGYPGREILQLYVSPPQSHSDLENQNELPVQRPKRELRGFAKTRLLPQGQSETLSIELDSSAFAYFASDGGVGWKMPKGRYTVEFAASSMDIRGSQIVDIDEEFGF